MQLPLFEPKSDWRPPEFSDLPPDWNVVDRIGIDCETHDPELKALGPGVRRGGRVVGVSFALEDGKAFYLPTEHEQGDNMDKDRVWEYLRHQIKNFKGTFVGANISYDLDYLIEYGCDFSAAEWIRDVQVADPLIYELHMQYSLKAIGERNGIQSKDETKLKEAAKAFGVDPKSGLWRLPARFVGEYAENDAVAPLKLLRKQERRIDEMNLWDIYNLESEVTPCLVEMRRRGVRIDQDKVEQIDQWSLEEEAKELNTVLRETTIDIGVGNTMNARAVAPALKEIGLEVPNTKKGDPSIDASLLEGNPHKVTQAILRARRLYKLRNTYTSSIRRYMVNGRIHCTFNQVARETEAGDQKGVRYGRLSAIDPNLQNQPSRGEFAKMWRSIYIPDEGKIWACCDYSQQEPRWTTHFGEAIKAPQAYEAAELYRNDPTTDNHDMMVGIVFPDIKKEDDPEIFDKKRKQCKALYLGLCYGEGGAKLCRDLGLPTRWAVSYYQNRKRRLEYFETREEAFAHRDGISNAYVWEAAGEEGQGIIDNFNTNAPFVKDLADTAKERVNKVGYITTIGGRRLHFSQKDNGQYDYTHKSLNRLIQGSAADQMKRGLVDVMKAGHFIQLQVHDELDGSVENREEAEQIAEIMVQAYSNKSGVPAKVDIELGENWGYIE